MIRPLFGIAAVVAVIASCGGNGSDEPSTEDIVQSVADAVNQPGMVYHAAGDDGSEVWIDAETQQFRHRDAVAAGGDTSIGNGWVRTSYDPLENVVSEEDLEPAGSARPRIDHPMAQWMEPLTALAYGTELRLIGKTTADGKDVYALEARSPVLDDDGNLTGYLEGRVEVDAETYLPHAFERRRDVPSGAATPAGEVTIEGGTGRVVYTTSELIPRTSLPDDFFDPSIVNEQVKTLETEIQAMRELGLRPFWLGEEYQAAGGILRLPEGALLVNPANSQGEVHYSLVLGEQGSADTVIVRLSRDPDEFSPPTIPEIVGELPEQSTDVTARGQPAVVYTSVLSPADIGCGDVECPETDAPLYTRLVFTQGETSVQIESFARVGEGGIDQNGYNSVEGILALAEELTEAEV